MIYRICQPYPSRKWGVYAYSERGTVVPIDVHLLPVSSPHNNPCPRSTGHKRMRDALRWLEGATVITVISIHKERHGLTVETAA